MITLGDISSDISFEVRAGDTADTANNSTARWTGDFTAEYSHRKPVRIRGRYAYIKLYPQDNGKMVIESMFYEVI